MCFVREGFCFCNHIEEDIGYIEKGEGILGLLSRHSFLKSYFGSHTHCTKTYRH